MTLLDWMSVLFIVRAYGDREGGKDALGGVCWYARCTGSWLVGIIIHSER